MESVRSVAGTRLFARRVSPAAASGLPEPTKSKVCRPCSTDAVDFRVSTPPKAAIANRLQERNCRQTGYHVPPTCRFVWPNRPFDGTSSVNNSPVSRDGIVSTLLASVAHCIGPSRGAKSGDRTDCNQEHNRAGPQPQPRPQTRAANGVRSGSIERHINKLTTRPGCSWEQSLLAKVLYEPPPGGAIARY